MRPLKAVRISPPPADWHGQIPLPNKAAHQGEPVAWLPPVVNFDIYYRGGLTPPFYYTGTARYSPHSDPLDRPW